MAIRVVVVGKKHESWVSEGIERYQKRLKKPFDMEWVLVPHSSREGLQARQEESEAIQRRLNPDDFTLLLDERGKLLNSPALSQLLVRSFSENARATVIIGGAYGVTDDLRERADKVVSLSPMVFPHQLVRLILTEQIYRAEQIVKGSPYHHE